MVATHLVFKVEPSNDTAGAVISPPVQVIALDALGDTAALTGSILLTIETGPAGGVLAGTKTRSAVAGVATFANLSIKQSGTYTLRATRTTPASPILAPAISQPFTITSGPAAKLFFTVQASPTAAGDAISPAVQVTARDVFGNTATDFGGSVTVALRQSPTGGVLSGTLTASAVAGVATFADLWLNKSGNNALKATSGTLTVANGTLFVVGPAAPSQLFFQTQPANNTPAGNPIPAFKVTARDRFGNTAGGFNGGVTLTINTGPVGATLSGTTPQTASLGTATFTGVSLDKVGPYTLRATADGLTGATSNGFNIKPNSPTHLVFTVQPSTAAPGVIIAPPIQVTVQDAFGNPVPNVGSITLAIGTNPGAGTLSGTLTRATPGGVATFANLKINNADSGYTLVARLGTILPPDTSAAFDIGINTATQLAFTVQPVSTAAGATIAPPVQVAVQNAQGGTVTGYQGDVVITITNNPGGGTLAGTDTVAVANGLATFSNLSINNAGTGYTLQATSGALTAATSAAFDITGPATQLVFTVQPTTTTAGAVIAPAVTVTAHDELGNKTTDFTGDVSMDIPGHGPLSGTLTVAAVAGVATFSDLRISRVRTGYTLRARSDVLVTAVSAPFDVTAGPAAQLVFRTQPTTTTAGKAITPAVEVTALDAGGNFAADFSGSVNLAIATNPGGGVLSGATAMAAVAGVATFPGLSINNAGAGYTLQTTSGSLSPATSDPFNIAEDAPTQLAFTVQPRATPVNAAITPGVRVTVQNSLGSTVTGFTGDVTIAIAANPTSGTLSGTTTVAAVAGVATFSTLSIEAAGSGYTLQATSVALPQATSTGFAITAVGPISPAVTVGYDHSCALTSVGTVHCWGHNDYGQAPSSRTGSTYTQLSSGNRFSCALVTDGTFGCWGANDYGQAPVNQAPPAGLTFTQVGAGMGYLHTCALVSDGTARCWGNNSRGQAPADVTPPAGRTFSQLAAGLEHNCALVNDGTVSCWGDNSQGQAPPSQLPPPGRTFTQVSSGFGHTCALVSDGTFGCWGRGNDIAAPASQAPPPGTTFIQVSTGFYHTCAVVSDGTIFCLGDNNNGQAPPGLRAPPPGTAFTQVSAAQVHTCALVSDGSVACWGNNYFGEAAPPSGFNVFAP